MCARCNHSANLKTHVRGASSRSRLECIFRAFLRNRKRLHVHITCAAHMERQPSDICTFERRGSLTHRATSHIARRVKRQTAERSGIKNSFPCMCTSLSDGASINLHSTCSFVLLCFALMLRTMTTTTAAVNFSCTQVESNSTRIASNAVRHANRQGAAIDTKTPPSRFTVSGSTCLALSSACDFDSRFVMRVSLMTRIGAQSKSR